MTAKILNLTQARIERVPNHKAPCANDDPAPVVDLPNQETRWRAQAHDAVVNMLAETAGNLACLPNGDGPLAAIALAFTPTEDEPGKLYTDMAYVGADAELIGQAGAYLLKMAAHLRAQTEDDHEDAPLPSS